MSWHFRTTTIVRLIFYLLLFIQICDPSSARCCLPTICDKHCAVFSHIAWAYSSWVYKRSIEWSHTIKIRLILRMYNISSSKDDTTLCQFKIFIYCMYLQISIIYIWLQDTIFGKIIELLVYCHQKNSMFIKIIVSWNKIQYEESPWVHNSN